MAQKQRARKSRKHQNSDEIENEMDSTDRSVAGADSDPDETQPESPIISNPANHESRKRKKSTSTVRVSEEDGNIPKSANRNVRVSTEDDYDDYLPKSGKKVVRVSNEDDYVPKSVNRVVRVSKEDDNVPKSANRVWSEDDEIAILEGMIDYQLKKGVHAYSDLGTFYEFFKHSLNAAVSKTQFTDKIRKLRHKYETKLVNPVFSKPHEQILFDLSSKIWGSGAKEVDDSNGKAKLRKDKKDGKEVVGNAVKEKKKEKVNEKEKEETRERTTEVEQFKYPYLFEALQSESFFACSKEMVKHNIGLIGSEMAGQMNKEWKQVHVMEMKLFAKKLELMKKHNQVLLEEMTASQP